MIRAGSPPIVHHVQSGQGGYAMFTHAFYVTALVIIGFWTALAIAVAPVRHSRIRKQKEKEAALLRRTSAFPYADADDAWYPESR